MTAWMTQLIDATDAFIADALLGWREAGIYRPSEFWVDKIHDACGGVE